MLICFNVLVEHTVNITQAAMLLGVSVKTLQKWDRAGKLSPAARTPTNRRLYSLAQLHALQGQRANSRLLPVTLGYVRVSSSAQKPDLANQRARLEEFCAARGLSVDEWITDIGSGLNFQRPKFLNLFDRIVRGQVRHLVIAHKDRLARFGFDFLAHLCVTHNCELIVMNHETLSPEREMVEDLMEIVHCFSARLDGLRNYRKTLREALLKKAKTCV